jgi:hypothetical protein
LVSTGEILRERNMKKTNMLSTALILLLTFSTVAILIPQVNAHTPPWTIPTWAYVVASPPTIGVNEQSVLVMWLDKFPPTAGGTSGDMWRGFKIDVTAPDGSKSQLGPFTSGPVGTTWTAFTPTQIGVYTFVFSWPGQVLANPPGSNPMGLQYVGDNYLGATSEPGYLTVTQAQTQMWQEPPLPTGFWARPLNAQNRDWSQLASNWLRGSWLTSNNQRWGKAPNSPHIVWSKPQAEQPGKSAAHPGGIADAAWPGQPYNTDDYQSPWGGAIIMNGIIYYNSPGDAMSPKFGYYAMNLRSGEQLWYKNGTDNGLNNPTVLSDPSFGIGPALSLSYPRLSQGMMYHYDSVNGQGMVSYLVMTQGSTWYILDPDTGDFLQGFRNMPSGTGITDQDGSIMFWNYNATTGVVTAWNMTQAWPFGAPGTSTSAEQWRVRVGAMIDAQNDKSWTTAPLPGNNANGNWTLQDTYHTGYSVNTTMDKNLPGISRVLQDSNRIPKELFGFRVNAANDTFTAYLATLNPHVTPYYGGRQNNSNLGWGISMDWSKNWNSPLGGKNITYSLGQVDYDNRVFTVSTKETMQWYGYSLDDGSLLWGPTAPQSTWDMYGMGGNAAYGNLYSCGYGGTLYAYDIKTGVLKWTYNATNVGTESPYGNFPLSMSAFCNGKIFLTSSEHSPTKPLWRGSYLRAVDAISGHEIWKIQDWVDSMAIADGYIVAANHYDNNIYCFGTGQSAVTVTAPEVVQGNGTAVLIKGTVTDQSPGAKDTPAIADAYMQQWMEYLYMQQAIPGNAQGVSVQLTAIDQNGGTSNIGTVTSDMSGIFKTMWTPSAAGIYTIIASFAGTESYSPSYAETVVGVSQNVIPNPTPVVKGPNILPAETFYAFAALMVIIMVILAVLLLRKK